MKILVTGGTGLVGNALISKLVESADDVLYVRSKDCDLREAIHVDNVFKKFQPDVVVHLANVVGGLYANMDNNYTFLVDNLKINTNILENCKKYSVKRLINILSTCVFPDKGIVTPLTSDQMLNGEPHFSNTGYAHSKRFMYIASRLLSQTSDTRVVNLTPTNLYGKNDNYNLIDSHVIPAIIHKTYLAHKKNNILFIKGSGKALRQFLYAEDFANVIYQYIYKDLSDDCTTMIVSPPSASEVSIRDLVKVIVTEIGFEGRVIYDPEYSDGQMSKTTDSNELLHHLPHFHFTDLQQGLKETIKHFVENYENVRK